jgi:hypothetical protein
MTEKKKKMNLQNRGMKKMRRIVKKRLPSKQRKSSDRR